LLYPIELLNGLGCSAGGGRRQSAGNRTQHHSLDNDGKNLARDGFLRLRRYDPGSVAVLRLNRSAAVLHLEFHERMQAQTEVQSPT
jgi:hypothetical protein